MKPTNRFIFVVCSVSFALYVVVTSFYYSIISSHTEATAHSSATRRTDTNAFVPSLRAKKILIEVTTVGQFQYAYFEHVLDNFRDLCEAGAKVSLHIITSNCDPNPKKTDPECPLYERSAQKTLENNYSVEKISQLNERLRCRDPDGSLDVSVRLISPDRGKQVVDHHRHVFYEQIDNGFDVFVHSEEDEAIRPANILAFIEETYKLRKRVGDEVSDGFFPETAIVKPHLPDKKCQMVLSASIVAATGLFNWFCSV